MKVRAKFEVQKVAEYGQSGKRLEIMRPIPANVGENLTRYESTGIPLREITLQAVYGTDGENASFAANTPTGTITFQLNNPDVALAFSPGRQFYVDFIPVEEK